LKTKNFILLLLLTLFTHDFAFTQSIYQVSYYHALFDGKLDGIVPMKKIIRHGDTRLGGHVLEVHPANVICEIMVAEEVVLKLPTQGN